MRARVVVAADEGDVGAEVALGREPAHDEAEAAPHVDDAIRGRDAARAKRLENRLQNGMHALALLELLREPQELVVRAQQHAVDEVGVEHTPRRRPRRDDARRPPHAVAKELREYVVAPHRQPRQRGRVVGHDEIGDLGPIAHAGRE
jgi:hypothetical protein